MEKFRGFRQAFRRFDKNYDGSLSFAEFVAGMNELGVHLSIIDFRLVFEKIDYNEESSIDYFKFCLLDYDQEATRESLIRNYQHEKLRGKVVMDS